MWQGKAVFAFFIFPEEDDIFLEQVEFLPSLTWEDDDSSQSFTSSDFLKASESFKFLLCSFLSLEWTLSLAIVLSLTLRVLSFGPAEQRSLCNRWPFPLPSASGFCTRGPGKTLQLKMSYKIVCDKPKLSFEWVWGCSTRFIEFNHYLFSVFILWFFHVVTGGLFNPTSWSRIHHESQITILVSLC